MQPPSSLIPSLSQGFDEMSSQPLDRGRTMQHVSQRPPETMFRHNAPFPYCDFSSSYHAQYQFAHESHQYPQNLHDRSPNLPSLRYMRSDRPSSGMENGYAMPSPCVDSDGYNYGNGYELEHAHYSSRRTPMYDQVQRNHQSYGDSDGNTTLFSSTQARQLPTYDASRSYAPLPAGYIDSEYSPHSPHPMSGSSYSNFGVFGDGVDSRSKKRRGNLPKPVTDILRTWFHEHIDHPYPSEDDKQRLIARTGLTISQVWTGASLYKRSCSLHLNRSVIGSSTQGVANYLLCETNIALRITTEEMANITQKATTIRHKNLVLLPSNDRSVLRVKLVRTALRLCSDKILTPDLS